MDACVIPDLCCGDAALRALTEEDIAAQFVAAGLADLLLPKMGACEGD
jgi:hypothetical protein